ncbi:MAG: hypothetical protein HFH67_02070 [Lachnospiraceae bacterium]|nr:hypothetical protein [Lachnospiraceae bacterium]
MTYMELCFILVIFINTIISLVYLIWNIVHVDKRKCIEEGRDNKAGYVIKFIIMVLCPVTGPMFFFTGYAIYRTVFRQGADLADVIFSKDRVKVHKRADTEREGNLAPIEEALAVSDKDSLRTLVLNVVRGDVKNSLASIALALNSEDTETSHYAASVLRDELNGFRQKSQELYNAIKQDGEQSVEYASILVEYMNSVLAQDVFHDMEQHTYVKMMEEAAGFLYMKDKEKLTPEYMEWICLRLLGIKEYKDMELWCDRSRELYPGELSTYTCQLKLYFTIEDKNKFFDVLNRLRQSDIVIDKETLELIRIFS